MISILVDAHEPIQALTVLGSNLENAQEPLTRLLEYGLKDARENLESRGVMFNEAWPVMSPWTAIVARALYQKDRNPLDILTDTGGLLASLFPEALGNILRVGPLEGEAGTEYVSGRTGYGIGSIMQNGTSRTFHVLQGEGFSFPGTPSRPFLSWHLERLEEYGGIFSESVWKGVDGGVKET